MFQVGDHVQVIQEAKALMSPERAYGRDPQGKCYPQWAYDMNFILENNSVGVITAIILLDLEFCPFARVTFDDDPFKPYPWSIPLECLIPDGTIIPKSSIHRI